MTKKKKNEAASNGNVQPQKPVAATQKTPVTNKK